MICISAIFGEYDMPKPAPLPQSILFTDSIKTSAEAKLKGWSVRIRKNADLANRYLPKAIKAAPQIFGINDDDVLWIDGSISFSGVDIIGLFNQVPVGGVGAFKHRWRNCIYDELVASLAIPKYQTQPIQEQAAQYRKTHPPNWGLWETGILVYRGAHKRIGYRWLSEMLAWSNQCQMSLPYVLRELKESIVNLTPGNVVENPWFHYIAHGTNHRPFGPTTRPFGPTTTKRKIPAKPG